MTRGSAVRERSMALALGACCLLVTPYSAADDQEALDRLFFTPERRQQLDRQRQMNMLDSQQVAVDPMLTVDGIVTRSSGRRTAWINGSPQHEAEMGNGLTVTPYRGQPGRVLVEANDARTARARVGETVNRNTGETSNLLNGGEVRIHSRHHAMKQAPR